MSIEKLIKSEWKNHKINHSKDFEWFECSLSEANAYGNYAVGCRITTTMPNGKEKTIVLKTKKEAREYGEKEKASYDCSVCKRFKRIISAIGRKSTFKRSREEEK